MTNNSLADIQKAFQASVRKRVLLHELAEVILEKPPISSTERLGIYQDAYFIRLTESLKDDFEDCCARLGTEAFEAIVLRFINAHASASPNLAEYSMNFSDFLGAVHPELYELATKEWLHILVLRSRDPDNELSASAIQNGQAFKVRVHPACHTRKFQGKTLLAYRFQDEVHFMNLDPVQLRVYEFFLQGRSLQDIEDFARNADIPESEWVTTVNQWMAHSILYCVGDA